MTFSPLGDTAVVLALGEADDAAEIARVRAVARAIERQRPSGVVDVVPAFARVTVFYDVARIVSFAALAAELERIAAAAGSDESESEVRRVEIPVCYGGESGPDLGAVAAHAGISPDEAVALHRDGDYWVQAIGFVPGFAYLGGLPEKLKTPRRATPRASVPAGSVGIGGAQTGIYPLATPGGWNLIGRTPLRLFDVARDEPALLRAGDRVKFRALTPEEFAQMEREAATERHDISFAEKTEVGGAIEVLAPGMLTTVQDLGRPGHRVRGVPASGAADAFAVRVANLLVGNPESAAVLEFTLVGPELKFERDGWIALGGAEFSGAPCWRPLEVKAGSSLNIGRAVNGCRGYLAIAGGIEIPPVLGSRSTYLAAGWGGMEGRALRRGDRLPVPAIAREIRGHWRIDARILPEYGASPTVRAIRGAHADEFDGDFLGAEYRVLPQSDRMGVRLKGTALVRRNAVDLVSAPVTKGTIQVPPDGQPIVLLADAQTIGGYPVVAQVISVDLPLMAQLRPGDAVRFRTVTLAEAHQFTLARERALSILREGIAQKFT
jgi:KipI family sensor histidine kinase inhibitor